MNNNISLLDVKAFVAVVTEGSFTKAAEELGSSKAHVSRQISQLEKALGVQLLIRTTRTLKLTEPGERFYSTSQSALAEIDKAASDAVEMNISVSGKIRINSLGGAFGEEYLSQAIAEFSAAYPDIHIDVSFDSKQVSLMDDPFDLIIRSGELPDSRMVSRHLMDMEIGLFCAPAYLKGAAPIRHPRDLKSHKCLTGTIDKWSLVNISEEVFSLHIEPAARCANSRVLLNYAVNGMGICRLPNLYTLEYLENGQLVRAIEGWYIPPISIHLLYTKNRYQPERLRCFIQFLCEWFRKRSK
ncbi:putative Transcriptional regulator LysR family [Vibrio nigripulchritudo SFn27]|uniref:Putative Transcriptional regulator LysR family n=1 Tax=Vibrio nigripulchritudo TaxID=28173 RepID=U4KAX3_9VIBR|nr:LysR family transcriptional regulator [Vibrio nigripulchritudo]CCN81082.1 putative Transcriptional regulator LysR family [Vibrio nigripulchritudo BLFn1]CCN86534.1 putative Transcriptional regulator LysR family [Vibrio nigripulchritudo SFn27]CCN92892.1 putative Transcriptional regulator LysR family [Vibrio nigripulchritudo ENn2]CCO40150.1 putative Transcriptional regulator LysR family [Vibrio nigripulchritudo SFn135]CCO52385.1 putative Transcriptional regulator LysR family [Vibrio nigripulch